MSPHHAASPPPARPLGRVRGLLVALGIATCCAVVSGSAAPSWAGQAEPPAAGEPAGLGGFALGDGAEGLIDPASGAFSFALPVAGISVAWDSRVAGSDRAGLGPGWSIAGLPRVEVEGGVRVSPSSGGVYRANASVTSGLDGYLLGDVVFRQRPTTLAARSDGLRAAVEAAFELIELGGVRTYFDAAGNPISQVSADGTITDTTFDDVVPEGAVLPVGLPVAQRVTTPDGLVQETRHELSRSRTAHTATETFTGRTIDVELTRTDRREFDVGPDGAVRAERAFPQGGAGTPVVTLHDRRTDLVAGTVRATTTVAAGTEVEATSTQVTDLLHGGVLEETGPTGATVSAVYDELGRPVSRTDQAGGSSAQTFTPDGLVATTTTSYGQTTRNEYDPATRTLVHSETTSPIGATVSTAAEHDPVTGELTAIFDPADRAGTEIRFEYDAWGNLTLALDGTRFTYQADNQPDTRTDPDGTITETGYWATGQRARQGRPGGDAGAVFHWDGDTLLNDTHTGDDPAAGVASVTAAYLIGNGRHARSVGGVGVGVASSTAFLEADFHGNITELTGRDGTITTSYRYTDYGETQTEEHASGTPSHEDDAPAELLGDAHRNPFQYAGEYTDVTGTQHLQARTYDPISMRLTSVDPEAQHNRYHYAALNPIALADPTGRTPDLPPWTYALLAFAGLAFAGLGFAGAVSAMATAGSIGAMTTSTTAVMVGTGIVAGYDLAATIVDLIDQFQPSFVDDETAFLLGITSLGAGAATTLVGFGTRYVTRIDIIRARARDASLSEGQARALVAHEYQIGAIGKMRAADMGFTVSRRDLVRSLHERLVTKLGGSWSFDAHRAELRKVEEEVWSLRPRAELVSEPSPEKFVKNVVFGDDADADELRNVVAGSEFAKLWGNSSLTRQVHDARDRIARFLAKPFLRNGRTVSHYPTGTYRSGYTYRDRHGRVILQDDEFLGWGHQWRFVLRANGHEM